MLSSSEKYELKRKFRHLESQICKLDGELDSKADLVDGVVPVEQLPITQEIIDALNNANAPNGTNYFTTLADLSSITPGTLINVAANYSALPAANTVSGEFYWVENSQGTSWLPGPLGGTYYPNGLYYSNGTTWIFTDMPYNATQVEVDAGLNNNKFVTPQTFTNASKWGTKFDNWTVTSGNTGTLTGTNVLWLVDTSAARSRTLDSAGNIAHIKDITGNAFTNNITINAPVGQTINGAASETIDADFGWVEYKLNGTDWTTTAGDSGGSINQLIIDSIPTNGSTNPVSSDGVFDALALKQDALTNPVTGTGTSGQVSYFNGTSTVTGSANLFWDAVNSRLGVGTNDIRARIHSLLSGNASNGITGTTLIGQNSSSGNSSYLSLIGSFNADAGIVFTDESVAYRGRIVYSNLSEYMSFWTDGSERTRIFSNGNISIGTSSDLSARLGIRGSGATSSTTALLVQNGTPTNLFSITDNGQVNYTPVGLTGSEATSAIDIQQTWNTTGTPSLIKANVTDTASNANSLLMDLRVGNVTQFTVRKDGTIYFGFTLAGIGVTSGQLSLRSNLTGTTSGNDFIFSSGQGPRQNTTGTHDVINIRNGAAQGITPTSGTAVFNIIHIPTTINQTGGANGITRGLYVNPTLTAAADWRSIEWSNSSGWGLYGAGTANNYLAGSLGIGSATLSNYILNVGKNITGSVVSVGIGEVSTILSDVTNTAYYYFSSASTQATTFNLGTLNHYGATQGNFGLNSTVTNQNGFFVASTLIGATNNFGFRGSIPSGTNRWNIYMDGTAANYLAGDTAIGTTTTSGGRLTVRGSGTTSATTALLVQNSTPSSLVQVLDNGTVRFGNQNVDINTTADGTNTSLNGRGLIFTTSATSQSVGAVKIVGNSTFASGSDWSLWLSHTFNTSSGTSTHSGLLVTQTINQTGGANGITRGLYVNPTLTSAADWRSIEWSNNTGWGLYGAGTANNYLAGSLGIGTTSLTANKIRIGGTVTGATSAFGVQNAITFLSDVTTTGHGYTTGLGTQATAFNMNFMYHYRAQLSGIGAGSTIGTQVGFVADGTIVGATNNYGFQGAIAADTGRWNLYMSGTAANYLAGDTAIGTTTTSGGRLTVRGSTTTSAANSLLVEDSAGTDLFVVRNDGGYAFKGGTLGVAQTGYTTFTNLTTDRTCDANATTVEELADILGTLIEDLKIKGIISA